MRIEVLRPLKVKLSTGDLYLTPGEPVDLPDSQARKLLVKVPGAIRVLATRAEWLDGFREVVRVTHGITRDDPRFIPVNQAWDACDTAFERDNWGEFVKAVNEVLAAVGGASRT